VSCYSPPHIRSTSTRQETVGTSRRYAWCAQKSRVDFDSGGWVSVEIGQDILDALTRGGVSALRAELAQLLNAAIVRLSRRGTAAKQLALVAEAAARSDESLAVAMDNLSHQDRIDATRELIDALTPLTDAPEDAAATEYLLERARAVHAELSLRGLIGDNENSAVAMADRGSIAISHSGQGNVTIDLQSQPMKPLLIVEVAQGRLLCSDQALAERIAMALLERHGPGAAEKDAKHRA
jgi:hypothetical protein